MNIKPSAALKNAIRCAKQNIQNSPYNAFLDIDLSKSSELDIQIQLSKCGHPEFNGSKDTWPSLYVSSASFKQSPYHQNIHFNHISQEGVSFHPITLDAHRLFNLKEIQADPNHLLADWMVLRALDEPLETGYLEIEGESWMLDAPSEQATIDPCALKAHGNTLVFGLGIGYFLYMASLNPQVKSLTVIEHNSHVIELFKRWILPQFKTDIPIEIIHGDAYDYFSYDNVSRYDYVFVDIWQSSDDGLVAIEKLCERYLPPYEQVDFWIEHSCTEILPALMVMVLEGMLMNKPFKPKDTYYASLSQKIKKVLDADQRTLSSVDDLKTVLYDRKLHRLILSQSIEA